MSLIKLPRLIDMHVHLRDPGQTQKEDFTTGTQAAIAGGFATICDMPNNAKLIDSVARFEEKKTIAREKICCDIGLYFGTQGTNMAEFPAVQDRVCGLKIYLNETTGSYFVHKDLLPAIYTAWKCAKPILLHAESDMISAVLDVVRKTGQKTHICHVARKEELALIIRAKEEQLPVTCGVTPHHLFLSEKDVSVLGPLVAMKPPLTTEEDVRFLWDHLDMVDAVESDHAPHTIAEKQASVPPYGVPGLETTLPLLLSAVHEGRLTVDDVIRLLHAGPRSVLSLQDEPDTYTEVDTEETYTIENAILKTKCRWSPFAGRKAIGKVQTVVIRGTKVYEDGQILVKPGWGRVI